MKRLFSFIVAFVALIGSAARAVDPKVAETVARPRFAFVDVYLDPSGEALAAYQVELLVSRDTQILSLEGGDPAAFKAPPFYDPAAITRHRIILAAFQTGEALPSNKSRVARVHVQTAGKIEAQVKLIVAGARDARSIPAEASVTEGEAR